MFGAKTNKMLIPRTRWDVVKGHSPVCIGRSGEDWPEWVGNQTIVGQNVNRKIFTKRVYIELIQRFLGEAVTFSPSTCVL